MPDEPAVSEEFFEKGRHEGRARTTDVHHDEACFFRLVEMDEFSLSDDRAAAAPRGPGPIDCPSRT